MTHSIGKTIAELRKGKGWTQVELAEKLNVSDKAISKWESEAGMPEITQLPALAEVFNVSIDFLMTGKKEESVSIEDMDSEKREMLFIKKDDAKNFEKYGYVNSNIVLCESNIYGMTTRCYESKVLDVIYENHSKKIFALLLKASLRNKDNLAREIFNRGCSHECLLSKVVCGDLDKYIRMCCEANCPEGLEFINLKYFIVGEQTKKEKNRFTISDSYTPGVQEYFTFVLGIDTLKYALNPKTSSDAIIDYFCDIEFFKENGKRVYFMVDDVVSVLYENKDYKRINKILEALNENNKYASNIYSESTHGSWYTGKNINRNGIYFSNNGMNYLRAYIYPLVKTINSAIQNNDFKLVKEFNKYNRELNRLFPDLKIQVYSDNELKIMELKLDSKTPVEELYSLKCLDRDFFNIHQLLSCNEFIECEDKVKFNEIKVKHIKELRDTFVAKYYISPMELIYKCIKTKNNKRLFEFATDLQFDELQNAIIDNNKDSVLEIAKGLFLPDADMIKKLEHAKENVKNIQVTSGSTVLEEDTKIARDRELQKYCRMVEKDFISEKQGEYRRKVDLGYYSDLLIIQFENIPFGSAYSSLSLESIEQIKLDICDKAICICKDEIESITHKNLLEKEYQKITNELSKEYLMTELDKGEEDKVVVLICKRLQILLQCRYGYEGDLFTMIDSLVGNMQSHIHNCHDDEDNNYREYCEEDEKITRRISLLHKLRMKRNNIVHAELKEVSMTNDEIKECINLIEVLSK